MELVMDSVNTDVLFQAFLERLRKSNENFSQFPVSVPRYPSGTSRTQSSSSRDETAGTYDMHCIWLGARGSVVLKALCYKP
jgi:hypothetical protein